MSSSHGVRRRVSAAWELIQAREKYQQQLLEIENAPSSPDSTNELLEQELEYVEHETENFNVSMIFIPL